MALSGCSVQGKAVEAHFWDPCAELSDATLKQAGALPEKKNAAVQLVGWRICAWPTVFEHYWLNVSSTDEDTLSTMRRDPTYTDFRDVSVDGRKGQTYLFTHSRRGGCTVGFDTSYGSVHIDMTKPYADDACERAVDVARKLLPSLPS